MYKTTTKLFSLPLNIINHSSLKQQVPLGKQVVTDQILIGSHCHPITNTEGTQDIQNLKEGGKKTVRHFYCSHLFYRCVAQTCKWSSFSHLEMKIPALFFS